LINPDNNITDNLLTKDLRTDEDTFPMEYEANERMTSVISFLVRLFEMGN
jgi:hypothetical protein